MAYKRIGKRSLVLGIEALASAKQRGQNLVFGRNRHYIFSRRFGHNRGRHRTVTSIAPASCDKFQKIAEDRRRYALQDSTSPPGSAIQTLAFETFADVI